MPLSTDGRALRDRLFRQKVAAAEAEFAKEEKAARDGWLQLAETAAAVRIDPSALRRDTTDHNTLAPLSRLAPVLQKSIVLFGRALLEAGIEAIEAENAAPDFDTQEELKTELVKVIHARTRAAQGVLDHKALVINVQATPFFLPLERAESSAIAELTNELEIYCLRKRVSGKASATHTADLDDLTQLPRRGALDRDLASALNAATPQSPVAVLFSDIDHFKNINDTFKHAAGDAVLRAVAACYQALCQHRGAAYRYGGEEFVVLLPGTAPEEARLFAERLRAAVAALEVKEISKSVTVSIGIVVAESPELTADALLHKADTTMYESKHRGRNLVTMAAS